MKKKLFNFFYAFSFILYCLLTTVEAAEKLTEAPNCELSSFEDSKQIDLKKFKDKVLYVDFWASWCEPCAKSFPFMNELNHDLKEQGLQVIGVNLDENLNEAKLFLEKNPANFATATDTDQQCAKKFGLKAMPSSYLVDRSGVIRQVHLGFRPGEAKEFRVLVEQLLAEKPVAD